MKYFAIIVAGGTGKRMGNSIPKQFLLLKGEPVLCHTIRAFHESALKPEIILVLGSTLHDDWAALCRQYQFDIPHRVVAGGAERFFSVKNGLDTISGTGIVAIHDAVRPLISSTLISRTFEEAKKYGNAVAAIKPSESVRYSGSPVKRDEVLLIQTPQAFDIELLKKAYEQPYEPAFTDDATVAEKAGVPIRFVEGERRNIKITWKEDLEFADAIVRCT